MDASVEILPLVRYSLNEPAVQFVSRQDRNASPGLAGCRKSPPAAFSQDTAASPARRRSQSCRALFRAT